ncbi:MAG: L-serine ammonia-lyase, iron-sulfur-dependent, subunit alpha [Oscillospiraceae bacterium]|jgi:L-serine dehydratase|nr:L-serine ammonia-lyase, iron-sulfur-dependent, subunit alpha [Oscillospiraceae bacterium]
MNLDSMRDILNAMEAEGREFWEVVLETDMENRQVTREQSMEKMSAVWHAMLDASDSYTGERRSLSGLVGGQGALMRRYAAEGDTIGGDFISQVISEALAMGECNACMRRIVAAPTAGACGVMPAVLIPLSRRDNIPEEKMLQALYVATGVGAVIAYKASISGAAGGCQAEVGSASAMAAGALVFLRGGSAEQICHGVAMAIKNMMGLVCDPVAGLVEVPCVKRNAGGAVNAVAAADMALAGIESQVPVDEVIDAMGEVGRRMPVEFRETALGGLAATPTGRAVMDKMMNGRKRRRTLTIKDARWKLERRPSEGENKKEESAQ